MKTKLIIATSFLILKSTFSFSQKDSSGIYFTANDYAKYKLSFAINCNIQKHKIKSDMVFHPIEISFKHADSTYTYPKNSVYGIKYCDGSVVRLYNNSEYPLINPDEKIMIYKVISSAYGSKGNPSITRYYFSKNEKDEILELTINKIKSVFPDSWLIN